MNKYNIEVGDLLGKDKVTGVDENGISFSNPPARSTIYNWHWLETHVNKPYYDDWKLTKMNKKIIGYTLLKDSISAKAGEVYKIEEGVIRRYKGSKSYVITQEEANQPEWFSPIYEEVKPTEVYVDTLAGKVKVTKKELVIGSHLAGEYLHTKGAERLLDIVANWKEESNKYDIKVETFKVGCKTFHVSDIPKLQEAIKQVS